MNNFKIPKIDNEKTTLKTVRLWNDNLVKLNNLSKNSNISVNRLINECIKYSLNNLSSEDVKLIKDNDK